MTANRIRIDVVAAVVVVVVVVVINEVGVSLEFVGVRALVDRRSACLCRRRDRHTASVTFR